MKQRVEGYHQYYQSIPLVLRNQDDMHKKVMLPIDHILRNQKQTSKKFQHVARKSVKDVKRLFTPPKRAFGGEVDFFSKYLSCIDISYIF